MGCRSLDVKNPVFYITATSKGTFSRSAAASSKCCFDDVYYLPVKDYYLHYLRRLSCMRSQWSPMFLSWFYKAFIRSATTQRQHLTVHLHIFEFTSGPTLTFPCSQIVRIVPSDLRLIVPFIVPVKSIKDLRDNVRRTYKAVCLWTTPHFQSGPLLLLGPA